MCWRQLAVALIDRRHSTAGIGVNIGAEQRFGFDRHGDLLEAPILRNRPEVYHTR